MKKIKASVGIILNQERNKVYLSLRQKHQSFSGYWEFPGGKLDNDESFEDALIRELEEEVDIKVRNVDYFDENKYTNDGKSVHVKFYIVLDYSGVPKSNENQKIEIVSISDLKNYQILPGSQNVVDRLLNINDIS